eukprot:m.43890 g.43890  ORF g.43890 m.43890 type:complete len:506 (-) comp19520_c0_seq2:96-1613(-)
MSSPSTRRTCISRVVLILRRRAWYTHGSVLGCIGLALAILIIIGPRYPKDNVTTSVASPIAHRFISISTSMWDGEHNSPTSGPKPKNILILSLELSTDIFSGNGVLGRVLVNSLLTTNKQITIHIICGCGVQGNGNDLSWVSEENRLRVRLTAIQLSGWGRLDFHAPWNEFGEQINKLREAGHVLLASKFSAVLAIDYSGWVAVEKTLLHLSLPTVWLCFRVFHKNDATTSTDTTDTIAFYKKWEDRAVSTSKLSVALSENDAQHLVGESADAKSKIRIIFPPLRGDLTKLAHQVSQSRLAHDDGRRFLTCCSRLSPEKNVEAFVELIEHIGALKLQKLGLTPRLVGSASTSNEPYAAAVKARLLNACPFSLIESFNSDPTYLAMVYQSTWLNFHPALYEAFGMTIVEAAAFSAPSLIDSGGGIGAADLLQPHRDEIFISDLKDLKTVATYVIELASAPTVVAQVAANAALRARSHDVLAYGRALEGVITSVLSTTAIVSPLDFQ